MDMLTAIDMVVSPSLCHGQTLSPQMQTHPMNLPGRSRASKGLSVGPHERGSVRPMIIVSAPMISAKTSAVRSIILSFVERYG